MITTPGLMPPSNCFGFWNWAYCFGAISSGVMVIEPALAGSPFLIHIAPTNPAKSRSTAT